MVLKGYLLFSEVVSHVSLFHQVPFVILCVFLFLLSYFLHVGRVKWKNPKHFGRRCLDTQKLRHEVGAVGFVFNRQFQIYLCSNPCPDKLWPLHCRESTN